MQDDNKKYILSDALNYTPEVSTTEVELLGKAAKKKSVSDFISADNQYLSSKISGQVSNVRASIEASEYAEALGQNYLDDWRKTYYNDTSSFQKIADMYKNQAAELELMKKQGGYFDAATGDYTYSPNYTGAGLPDVRPASMDNKLVVENYGSAESFKQAYFSESAGSSSGIFGMGNMAQTDMAMNMKAMGFVGEFISNFPGYDNTDPRERFSKASISNTAEGAAPLFRDLGSSILDAGRLFTGDAKVLGAGSLYSTPMDKALQLDDPVFRDWADAVLEDLPKLAMLDTNDEGALPGLAPLIQKYGQEEVIKLLTHAKNSDAMVYGFNILDDQRRMYNYTKHNEVTLGMSASMLAHGFQTDPTMALDVGLGMGLAVAGTVTGAAPVAAGGTYIAMARAGARMTRVMTGARKASRAIGRANELGKLQQLAAKGGVLVEKTGKVLVNARRVLPSQVFSELVFPSMTYMRSAKKAKTGWARGLADHILSDAQFANKSWGRRAWTRAWQNGMEGGIQGWADFSVMHANQQAILEATYGKDVADALQVDHAGMAMMVGAGMVMGGVMGSGLGAAFDGVGTLNNGLVTNLMDNKFAKGAAGIFGSFAEAGNAYNNFKILGYKQKLVDKLRATGRSFDEVEFDKQAATFLRQLELEGGDVNYGVKTALNALDGDGPLDVKTFMTGVRKHAMARADAYANVTGRPRTVNIDASRQALSVYGIGLRGDQVDEIRTSKASDYTAETVASQEVDTPEPLLKERAERQAALETKQREFVQLKKDADDAASIKKEAKGKGKGERKLSRELNRDVKESIKEKQLEMQEASARLRDTEAKIVDFHNEASVNAIAGNEMDYLKRLYHLAINDINNRLSPDGKARTQGDIALGNVFTVLDGKADTDTVSTTALRTAFRGEELSVLVDGKSIESRLAGTEIPVAEARKLLKDARAALLDAKDVVDISEELMELDLLARQLGSDEDARQLMDQVNLEAAVAKERRDMTGAPETTGLDLQSRQEILMDLDPDSMESAELSAAIYAAIDAKAERINKRATVRRMQNDRELTDLRGRRKNLAPAVDEKLEAAIAKRSKAIEAAAARQYKTTRKNIHNELQKQLAVRDRTSEAHVDALVSIVNRLRFEASRPGVARAGDDGAVSFAMTRNQVLAMLPTEYRFIINTLDGAMNADGTYDLGRIRNSLLQRIARADEDMAVLIRGGAEARAQDLRSGEGLEALELTETHLEAMGHAQTLNARALYAERGEYAGGGTREDWMSSFVGAFNERAAQGIIRKPAHFRAVAASYNVEVPEGELTAAQVLSIARDIWRAAGAIEEFADLGGGSKARAYITGEEAAYTIIEALESPSRADGALDNRGRFDTIDGSRDVRESTRPDVQRRLDRRKGMNPARVKRVGNLSPALTRRLFEQSRANDRISYLLFDDSSGTPMPRSDKDVETIYEWLKTLDAESLADEGAYGSGSGTKSFRLAPPQHIASALDKVPTDVDGWINGVVDSLKRNPPALIATIHDAFDAALPGMFGALDSGFANVTDSGFSSAQGIFGLGLGFRTLTARPGSLTDSMNTAFELTLGVRDFAARARKEYGDTLQPQLEKLGLVEAGAELTDAELIGAVARGLDQESTRAQVSSLFFSEAQYLDADASGANILMANMKYRELRDALESDQSLESIVSAEAEVLGRDGFDPGVAADLYNETKKLVAEILGDQRKLSALITEISQKASPEDVASWTVGLNVWRDILASPELKDELRNALFKAPVMTDLYNIGVDSMADDMVTNFFRGAELSTDAKAALDSILAKYDLGALSSDVTGTALGSFTEARALASKMAHLLHSSGSKIEGSLIKQAVFGKKFLPNEEIGKALLKVRDQQVAGVTRNPSEILNNPEAAMAAARAMSGLGTKENLTAHQAADLQLNLMLVYRAAQMVTAPNMRKGTPGATFERQFAQMQKDIHKAVEGKEGVDKLEAARATLDGLRKANTLKSDAFNSLANQNFHIDADKAKALFGILVGDSVAQEMFDNLDPLARQAMMQGFFRDLSQSNEGRFFVNTVLDMIADKSSRVGSTESPLGTARFFGADGKGMDDAAARRAAIMQLAVNAAEMTGELPQLSGRAHIEMDEVRYLEEWNRLDALHDKALNRTAAAVSNEADFSLQLRELLAAAGLPTDEATLKTAALHLQKLRKNALSGRTKVNDLGEENAVTRMGPWGMVDPRLNYNSKDAVGLAAASRIQMHPRMAGLRELNELDAIADSVTMGAMFSKEEMSSSVDVSEMAIPYESMDALDKSMTLSTDLGVGSEAGLRYRGAVMKATLDRFADDVGTKHALKLKKQGAYDKLFVLFRETQAIESEYQYLRDRSPAEVAELQAYGEALFNPQRGAASDASHRGHAHRHRARLVGRREVNKTAQWARDLSNVERSMLSMEGDPESRVLFTGGETYEDNLARTAQMNPTGQMMSWLFKPADSHGRVIMRTGPLAYKSNYLSASTPLFAQMNDSQFIIATALVESYTWKRVAQQLGIDNLTAERYRQLRAAVERSSGAMEINTDGFDPDIAALFTPDAIDATFARMDSARSQAEMELSSADFVGDLGATGEGRMLFNTLLEEGPGHEQIMAELRKTGMDVSQFEDAVFTKTIASESGKPIPTAFVNMFGEVINPHEFIGQARIALTAGERTRALNLTRNRTLLNRMRTGAALGLHRTPFEAEISGRMAGYDGQYGTPLRAVRRRAAADSEAVEFVMQAMGKKLNRKSMVTDLTSGRRFLDVHAYEDDAMIAEAQTTAALREWRSMAPVAESDLVDQWQAMATRLESDDAMQMAVLIARTSGELDRDGIAAILRLEDPDSSLADFNAYVDRVVDARGEVFGYLNDRAASSPAVLEAARTVDEAAVSLRDSNSLVDMQRISHDTVEELEFMDLPEAEFDAKVQQLQRRSQPGLTQDPAPSRQDALADESIDPRTIDDGRIHNKMLQLPHKSRAHRRLNTVLSMLQDRDILDAKERLLLDAVFADMGDDYVEHTFSSVLFDTPDQLPRGAAGMTTMRFSEEAVVQRIALAKDIHDRVNPDAPFGAAGVLLEEVGHLIELRMRAHEFPLYDKTVGSYMEVYGTRMDPVLKAALGQVNDTVTANEGFARSYAAVMLNRGAEKILTGMDVDTKRWFGEAGVESLLQLQALRDHADFRKFTTTDLVSIENMVRRVKPVDIDASLDKAFRRDAMAEGVDPEDLAPWRRFHENDNEQTARSYQDLADKYRDDSGRFDLNAAREEYRGDTNTLNALISNEIEANLTILGGGNEVTTALGEITMKALDRIRIGLGRQALHNIRATMSPASLLAKGFDAGWGQFGEMTAAMRGLFNVLSPTETMSMGGFSTIGGRRVPTLQGLQGEIRGRWDAPLETLSLIQLGQKELAEADSQDISKAIYDSLLLNNDSPLDSLKSDTDRAMAKEVRDQIRNVMALTADDMLEAGMLKSKAHAELWKKGMPFRLDRDAYTGDSAAAFDTAFDAHVSKSMQESDTIDMQALRYMTDANGELVWKIDGTARITPEFLEDLSARGYDELSKVARASAEELTNDMTGLTADTLFNAIAAKAYRGNVTRTTLGDAFSSSYNDAVSRPIAAPALDRARADIAKYSGMELTDATSYSTLKARKYRQRFGDSGYVIFDDPFISVRALQQDPALGKFIETDLVKVLDGVMRGPAAQALDRAVYGRAFGVKGLGVEDIINMLEEQLSATGGGRLYTVIDKKTGALVPVTKRLETKDRDLMRAQLKTMRLATQYAKGTASRKELDASDTPFFKFLNDVMALTTTALVAPKYILGSALEEVPHSALKGFGEVLSGMRRALTTDLRGADRATRKEVLRGITTFVRDLQHDAALDVRYKGADSTQFIDEADVDQTILDRMNRKLMRLTTLGFRELTQRIKTSDAAASIARLDSMLVADENGISMFDGLTDITLYRLEDLEKSGHLSDVLRKLGVQEGQIAGVREMIRMGVFDADTAPYIKDLMSRFADERSGNFDFTGAQDAAIGIDDVDAKTLHLLAVERIRTMVRIDSIRNAKENTLEHATLQANSLQSIITRLTSYSSMVSSSLRRGSLGSAGSYTMQLAMYMISGYLYFKASQMARGKSFERAVLEGWEENPEVELYDMLASVPFLGYGQMPLAFLIKQAGLGNLLGLDQFSTRGGKAYSLAGVSTLNRAIDLLSEAPKSIRAMVTGGDDGRYSSAEYLAASPLSFNFLWGPMLGGVMDAFNDSRNIAKQGFTPDKVQQNPNAYMAWMIRNAIDRPEVSIEGPSFDAQGRIVPAGTGIPAANAAQDVAAIEASRAAQEAQASQPAVPVAPPAPAPSPTASPSEAPLSGLPMHKEAPDSLK